MTCLFTFVGTLKSTLGLNPFTPQSRCPRAMTVVVMRRTDLASDNRSATNNMRKSCLRQVEVLKLFSPAPTATASMFTSYSSVGITVDPPSMKSTRGTWLRENNASRWASTSSSSCNVRWHRRQSKPSDIFADRRFTMSSVCEKASTIQSNFIRIMNQGMSTHQVFCNTWVALCCCFWRNIIWSYVIGICCRW